MRRTDQDGATAEEAVLRLVQNHAAELLRFAHRFSHCADDAHDAYQRSVEILLRRMRSAPPEQPLSWLRTVVRHEALAIRAERAEQVTRFELDLDHHGGGRLDDPAERVEGAERLQHAAEALQRLKPQELTALVLRAEGLSYKEICARTGWTYTRCNRAVTEGRRALAARLGAIESGAECDRWAPLLSALADGEATPAQLAELRPHLRRCSACRSQLRTYHAAPAQVAALVPPALLPLAAEPSVSLLGSLELAFHAVAERATLAALRVQGAFEGLTGTKVAAVAASTAALAGGGAAIDQARKADRPQAPAREAAAAVAPSGLPSPALVPAAAAGRPGRRAASGAAQSQGARRASMEFGRATARGPTSPEFADSARFAGTAGLAGTARQRPKAEFSPTFGRKADPPSSAPPPKAPAPAAGAAGSSDASGASPPARPPEFAAP